MAKASELFATGVTHHGALTGLGNDDHPQYLTAGRGDARYYPRADIDAAIAAKANAAHTHTLAGLTDVHISAIASGELLAWDGSRFINRTLAEAGIASESHSHAWAAITGKPASFAPAAHSHPISDVTGLQSALDGKANASHAHTLAGLTDVVITSAANGEALVFDGTRFVNRTLAEAGISAASHTHTKAQVGLANVDNTADADKPISTATQAALDGKAAATHAHAISSVTGLQSALDGKASASHGHTFASLSGKPTTLAGYGITDAATASHSHTWASITGKPASFAPTAHGHPISDVTGLQAALDEKLDLKCVIVSDAHSAQPGEAVAVRSDLLAITVSAPVNPSEGAFFFVCDAGNNAETNSVLVDFGGETYNGNAGEDFEIDVNEFGTGFLFTGGTWRRWQW